MKTVKRKSVEVNIKDDIPVLQMQGYASSHMQVIDVVVSYDVTERNTSDKHDAEFPRGISNQISYLI